jgi:hypothetical protein
MDELIGKAVNLRIKEKMQQPVVGGYGPEKVPVKDLLFIRTPMITISSFPAP